MRNSQTDMVLYVNKTLKSLYEVPLQNRIGLIKVSVNRLTMKLDELEREFFSIISSSPRNLVLIRCSYIVCKYTIVACRYDASSYDQSSICDKTLIPYKQGDYYYNSNSDCRAYEIYAKCFFCLNIVSMIFLATHTVYTSEVKILSKVINKIRSRSI